MITRDDIIELSKNLQEPKWLTEKRLAVFDSLPQDDFLKYGLKMHSDLTEINLDDQDFSVNGVDLVCDGAVVLELSKAAKDPKLAKILQKNMLAKSSKLNENRLNGLAASAFTDGYVVLVDKDSPNNLDLVISGAPLNSFTYVIIVVEEGCKSTIIESINVNDVHSVVVEVVVSKHANLKYISIQNNEEKSIFGVFRRSHIFNNAKLDWLSIHQGSKMIIERVENELVGLQSKASINIAYIGNNQQYFDIYTANIHFGAESVSNIVVKGVLDDRSSAFYRGLVRMEKSAKNSQGFQSEDALMISKDAKVNAVPNLEIETNKVKCSHGVTVSRLDKEKMFYLQSRGLNERQAKLASIHAHIAPVVEQLNDFGLADDVMSIVDSKLVKLV